MYLHLTSLNGDGYISTMTEEGSTLSCKPVRQDEYNSFLKEVKKNSNYEVMPIEPSKGATDTYLVREKSMEERLIKTQMEETGKMYYKSEYQKRETEFSRYKQDCRKRALDLAIESSSKFREYLGREVKDGKVIPSDEEVIPIFADKYYNWLISIPNN